jgi:hypothetical protein
MLLAYEDAIMARLFEPLIQATHSSHSFKPFLGAYPHGSGPMFFSRAVFAGGFWRILARADLVFSGLLRWFR